MNHVFTVHVVGGEYDSLSSRDILAVLMEKYPELEIKVQ